MSILGADLRALRRARGLTLAELAGRLSRSVGWMSQIERGLSTPDEVTLARIAETLDAPLTMLTAAYTGEIVRSGAGRSLGERVPGLRETLLSPDLTDGFEVVHSTFSPGARRDDTVTRHTTEIAHMISGHLTIWLGETRHNLGPGDTARLRGEPFRWENAHDAPAVAIWIITPAIYTQGSTT